MNNDSSHTYYIGKGETTAKLNYYREPRFYADLCFDRGIWEALAQKEAESIVIKNHSGEDHGVVFSNCHIVTGYFIKKLVSFRSGTTTASPSPYKFSIPIIRLADLYLLYAEALNESKDAPDQEVYQWVDSIRFRAGLRGVVESWRDFSNLSGKPSTKEGMRSIIKQERLIELCFEGQRFFDLRRWKDALTYLNQPIQGDANITYELHDESDISYVICEYVVNGITKVVPSSVYSNVLTIQGLAEEEPCDFTLYLVDHSENRFAPFKGTFTPLEAPSKSVFKTLHPEPDFGGITVRWTNETNAIMGVFLLAQNDACEWEEYDLVFSSQTTDKRSIRGYNTDLRWFGVILMDQYGNVSDTLKYQAEPRQRQR